MELKTQIINAAVLISNIFSVTQVYSWLSYSLNHLIHLMIESIRKIAGILETSRYFKEILAENLKYFLNP